MLHEPKRIKKPVHRNPFADMLSVISYALRKDNQVAALLLFSGLLFGATNIGVWLQHAYFILVDLPPAWFGILGAVGFMLAGLGSQGAHFLERFARPTRILIGLWLFICIAWALAGMINGIYGIVFVMMSTAVYGTAQPLVNDAINRRVDSSRRATVLSIGPLIFRLVFVLLGTLIGWQVDAYGVQIALISLALFLLIINYINARKLLLT